MALPQLIYVTCKGKQYVKVDELFLYFTNDFYHKPWRIYEATFNIIEYLMFFQVTSNVRRVACASKHHSI